MEQFTFLQNNIQLAGNRLKEQQKWIDSMERKMIDQLIKRRDLEKNIS